MVPIGRGLFRQRGWAARVGEERKRREKERGKKRREKERGREGLPFI